TKTRTLVDALSTSQKRDEVFVAAIEMLLGRKDFKNILSLAVYLPDEAKALVLENVLKENIDSAVYVDFLWLARGTGEHEELLGKGIEKYTHTELLQNRRFLEMLHTSEKIKKHAETLSRENRNALLLLNTAPDDVLVDVLGEKLRLDDSFFEEAFDTIAKDTHKANLFSDLLLERAADQRSPERIFSVLSHQNRPTEDWHKLIDVAVENVRERRPFDVSILDETVQRHPQPKDLLDRLVQTLSALLDGEYILDGKTKIFLLLECETQHGENTEELANLLLPFFSLKKEALREVLLRRPGEMAQIAPTLLSVSEHQKIAGGPRTHKYKTAITQLVSIYSEETTTETEEKVLDCIFKDQPSKGNTFMECLCRKENTRNPFSTLLLAEMFSLGRASCCPVPHEELSPAQTHILAALLTRRDKDAKKAAEELLLSERKTKNIAAIKTLSLSSCSFFVYEHRERVREIIEETLPDKKARDSIAKLVSENIFLAELLSVAMLHSLVDPEKTAGENFHAVKALSGVGRTFDEKEIEKVLALFVAYSPENIEGVFCSQLFSSLCAIVEKTVLEKETICSLMQNTQLRDGQKRAFLCAAKRSTSQQTAKHIVGECLRNTQPSLLVCEILVRCFNALSHPDDKAELQEYFAASAESYIGLFTGTSFGAFEETRKEETLAVFAGDDYQTVSLDEPKTRSVLYFNLLSCFPAQIRAWFDMPRRGAKPLYEDTKRIFSPLLIAREFSLIRTTKESIEDSTMSVHLQRGSGMVGVELFYYVEEFSVSVELKIPPAFPLHSVSLVGKNSAGVTKKRWNEIVLASKAVLTNPAVFIAESVVLWKENMQKYFEGVEPCPVCYSIIEMTEKSIPDRKCGVCGYLFHNRCLYQWFKKASARTCPMCRAVFSS
ncbi:MAG: RING Zn-finger domain-containing protein, partial [Amphiamblys sp. WSBS2006]